MLKRSFDIAVAVIGLIIFCPVLLVVAAAIWLYDRGSPFYIAARVARGGGAFRMVKFRSMIVNADKLGGSSTAASDRRITPIGHLVRSYKIDELLQLWNVLLGDMSLVGPRPQTLTDARMYTSQESVMLTVRPGITDIASIVFADEGGILSGSPNPDLLYNQIIRPWKSRLALAYVKHRSFSLDLRLLILTMVVIVSRPAALRGIENLLAKWELDPLLIRMAARREPLVPYPPPGALEVCRVLQG